MKQHVEKLWNILTHPARWLIVLILGVALVLAGIVFLVLPGPGIPLIILGLVVLATEFAWAQVVLERVKHHGTSAGRNFKQWFARIFKRNNQQTEQQEENADEDRHDEENR